jgi:hypothetical protein
MEAYVRIFLEVPTKYSPAEVVQILKGVCSREFLESFRDCPGIWGTGRLGSICYFVRIVRNKVTADVIR